MAKAICEGEMPPRDTFCLKLASLFALQTRGGSAWRKKVKGMGV